MLALFVAFALAAEEGPTWTVTVDPLTTALGYVHVQTEGRLSDHTSLYLGPHLRLFDGILTPQPEPYLGLGLEAGFRVFPWGKSPEGPWAMGRQVVAHISTTDGTKKQKVGGYSSVLLGYTGVLGRHFVLSGGAGLNVIYYDIETYGTSGLFPALHTNLGVAF